ncbi:MAG: chloride channel protein, partial [Pseudomonadota bacterium]
MTLFRPSRALMRLRRVLGNDQLVVSLMALAVGAAVGGAVIGFREAIVVVQGVFLGAGGEDRLVRAAQALPWWRVLLAPTLGGLLLGLFLRHALRGRRPPGVAAVIEHAAADSRMPPRLGLVTALAAVLSIGAGASVGREGPAVHLGATLGNWLAASLRFGRNLWRSMLACGVSAAVAASFNAPIAGALFANEVVVGNYALASFAPVVIASVTATVVSRQWFGDFPAFTVPAFASGSLAEFPAFALLGIPAGVAAAVL